MELFLCAHHDEFLANVVMDAFGNRIKLAQNEEIINLLQHEDGVSFEHCATDEFVMCSGLEVVQASAKGFVDVFFPWSS